jgi:DNA-binding transcriptional regulator LsrR (DeoR family)
MAYFRVLNDQFRGNVMSRKKIRNEDANNHFEELSDAKLLEEYKRYFIGKGVGMPTIAKSLDIKQGELRRRLRDAYNKNSIIIKLPVSDGANLSRKWPNVTYHVLNTIEEKHFYRGSAEIFFQEMWQVLKKREPNKPLRIGVMSGRTTGGMIESICNVEKNWGDFFSLELLPPEIYIYALNVSQTDGYDDLKGNANILSYELARRFKMELNHTKVEAYGLSAALLQTKEEAQRTDCSPQTRMVLKFTDPERLRSSLSALGKAVDDDLPNESQLDIVITGVGSIKDSLFKQYCEASAFNINHLINEQSIVGDIAYCPVTRMGEERELRDKENRVCEFYRAVSIKVLKEMSHNPSKKVILVARNSSKSRKTDPIHAAITEEAHLCNSVITDSATAEDLYVRLGTF